MPAYFMSKQTSTPRGMRCNHPPRVSVSLTQTHPLSLSLFYSLSLLFLFLSCSFQPFAKTSRASTRLGPLQKDLAGRKALAGAELLTNFRLVNAKSYPSLPLLSLLTLPGVFSARGIV